MGMIHFSDIFPSGDLGRYSPTKHSYMIAPRDHQSHSLPYPFCKKISGEICTSHKRE